MTKASSILQMWPVPVAVALSILLLVSAIAERVTFPDWFVDAFEVVERAPDVASPSPEIASGVPYAPIPGRDDRTPVPYISQVFSLGDPALPAKLSGIGAVFWDHGGQGSGTLVAPNLVLTTGHLFAERGRWYGPHGRTDKPPAPSDGRIYLHVCGRAYDFKAIHMGSMSPRMRLGIDYAIAELAEPACPEAAMLPVARSPEDLETVANQIVLNMGAYRFAGLPRFAAHPVFGDRDPSKHQQHAVFGVSCAVTGREDTGDIQDGSTGVIVTSGCDGIPGGSGGSLLVSRDAGASYHIVGVANSYRPNTEYNNYTRIEGAFAKHLSEFVDLSEVPPAYLQASSPSVESGASAPWIAMSSSHLTREWPR